MVMSTKQSKVYNETIWKSTDLRNFPSLDLANLSIYMETGESCCLKWSFSLTLCEIPWRLSSILPNVKISLTHCKIPWQFTDLEKFYFSLTFPWRLWTLRCVQWTMQMWVLQTWITALGHSGLQQSARPHIRVSVGDEKWSNSRVPAACKQPTQLPARDA